MTIDGWIIFGLLSLLFFACGGACLLLCESAYGKVLGMCGAVIATILLLVGMLWYFQNTASGQRALVDQKSEFNNGLDRTITIYTADGKVLAEYTGEIDIEGNDGGYVLFDYNGKRYTYYNCFVESIADIS